MASEFEIWPYAENRLAEVLANRFVTPGEVRNREHFKYLAGYFSEDEGVFAKTIIAEKNYISKSYFSDYSNFYSLSFQEYERHCKRIHFFDIELDDKTFKKELFDLNSLFLENHYLGYIVIKPLPDSIIGATLLKTYKHKTDRKRHYPAIRNYDINLFGRNVKLDSMAFQEQDSVVAACASVAIWSAFHKTADLFQTNLPSPSEITKSAGNLFRNSGRTFPNKGLDLYQICKTIENVGLVSEIFISKIFEDDVSLARRMVYAYLRAGIPILLFLDFRDATYHLITINGYSDAEDKKDSDDKITLWADGIKKFFAHDDTIGPFAEMGFSGNSGILTPLKESAWIFALIVPLHSKIRIEFQDVFDHTLKLNGLLKRYKLFGEEIEWDVYLIESNKYKSEILELGDLGDLTKQEIVTKNYPRYLWVSRGVVSSIALFDFIYDSTDTASGFFCMDFNLLFPDAKEGFRDFFRDLKLAFVDDITGPRLGQKLHSKILDDLK